MIPAEAVEAAAKALYFYLDEDHRGAPLPWESLAEDDDAKIDAKEAARIALEAAAPYMLAGPATPEQIARIAELQEEVREGWAKLGRTVNTNPYMRDTEGEK